MTVIAILLGLVSMVIRQGAVQPWLTEYMGFYFVTVMTTVRPFVVGSIQGVALTTRGILALVILVPFVIPVQPF